MQTIYLNYISGYFEGELFKCTTSVELDKSFTYRLRQIDQVKKIVILEAYPDLPIPPKEIVVSKPSYTKLMKKYNN